MWMLLALLIVTLVALVTGPYAWAVAARRWLSDAARVVRVTFAGTARGSGGDEAVVWASEHYQLLRYGGIAVAVVLIAALDLSLITFLIVAALLALFEVGVQRIHSLPLPPRRHAPV
jgi:hypothetical protein